tara:strand:- start:237 stop:1376 length:1140 start_codon:yes stop_codon:yes gene_type:complete
MALTTVSSDRLATNVKTSNLGTELSKKVGQKKNLIINGSMQVAQRGTSSTTSGYGSVDRFRIQHSGTDNAPTQSQVDVAAGTTPYTLGFRKASKITNGNQTSGAGSSDHIYWEYYAEAQDIAKSGWNYLSSSSFVTLSFWIKSSVAQNFYGSVRTRQGTSQNFPFETGSLSADTWTKITKTIPGNSNLQFDNDTAKNFQLNIMAFLGTDGTASGVSLNTWAAYAAGTRTPDQTSTWYTTNSATLEITGVQLEVGSVATDFEHRSFGQELALCQRYFTQSYPHGVVAGSNSPATVLRKLASGNSYDDIAMFQFPTEMRAVPTIVLYNPVTGVVNGFRGDSNNFTGAAINTATTRGVSIYKNTSVTATVFMSIHATASAEL